MLDYNLVKKFHANKLREDAEGDGRVESAFYHTMRMVYLKGVEDGELAVRSGDQNPWRGSGERPPSTIVGIIDQRE